MQGMELSIWLKHIPKESPEFIPTNSNFTPKSSFFIKLFVRYSYALFFKTRLITNPWLPLKYINSFLKESKVSLVMERKEKESNYL